MDDGWASANPGPYRDGLRLVAQILMHIPLRYLRHFFKFYAHWPGFRINRRRGLPPGHRSLPWPTAVATVTDPGDKQALRLAGPSASGSLASLARQGPTAVANLRSGGHLPQPAVTQARRGPSHLLRPAVTLRGLPSLVAARVTRSNSSQSPWLESLAGGPRRVTRCGPSHSPRLERLKSFAAARVTCHGPSQSPRPKSLLAAGNNRVARRGSSH